jgi:hypothetical protein
MGDDTIIVLKNEELTEAVRNELADVYSTQNVLFWSIIKDEWALENHVEKQVLVFDTEETGPGKFIAGTLQVERSVHIREDLSQYIQCYYTVGGEGISEFCSGIIDITGWCDEDCSIGEGKRERWDYQHYSKLVVMVRNYREHDHSPHQIDVQIKTDTMS